MCPPGQSASGVDDRDNGVMPTVGPIPQFHELPVLVDFHPAIALAEARRVMAAVHGLVRRYADTGHKVDELPAALSALVAEYGYTARMIGRTREAIEFGVTKQ